MGKLNENALKEAQNLVLLVTGGIGRNIMATAVVRNLKKAYPDKKLIVVCGSPDIFVKNPHIDRLYNLGNCLHFYDDWIKDSKSYVINVEPYQHFDYIYKKKHFVECWCDLIGIPCDNIYPDMFFSKDENEMAQELVKSFDKELVMVQFEGGKVPVNGSRQEQIIAKSGMYRRHVNPDTQKKIADELNMRNFRVGVVANEFQYRPGCTEQIKRPVRAIICMTQFAREVICIDSFLMHGCAVFKKKAIVLWAGTSPIVLGYPNQINQRRDVCETPECHRPNSFLFDIEVSGYQWECPWNNRCTDHEWETVMKAFDEQTKGKEGVSRDGKPADGKAEDNGKPKAGNAPDNPISVEIGVITEKNRIGAIKD